ncbi:MAG: hypothetical protein VKP62_10925 [Candidatus Sericytochromatia bacterium]|nr:hypothetical protein [Candidatus Sericytochromatia bacterium]
MSERAETSHLAAWVCAAATVASLWVGPGGLHDMRPAAGATMPPTTAKVPPSDRLWFNRRSGYYHTPQCIYYTQTKDGLFLSVEEATRIGSPCGHCFKSVRRPTNEDRGRKAAAAVKAWLMP